MLSFLESRLRSIYIFREIRELNAIYKLPWYCVAQNESTSFEKKFVTICFLLRLTRQRKRTRCSV